MARLLKVLLLAALVLMIGSLRSSIAPSTPENLEISEPAPSDDVGQIHAIEASATGEIWVVGETRSKPTKGLIARRYGTEWKKEASLSIAGGDHRLYDITILSPNDIWAVGEYVIDPKTARALVVHWDGAEWKVVTGIDTGPGNNGLHAITAVAPDDIWVGGWSFQEGRSPGGQSLILHWNGETWSNTPLLGGTHHTINDLSAVSADDVWAVTLNVIFHWDGQIWSEAHRAVDPGGIFGKPNLVGVEAISEQDVWVVGSSYWAGGCDHGEAHILHWDGYTWSSVPIPAIDFECIGPPSLADIHALAPDDIWAVGAGLNRPMAMHWDGTTWSLNACPEVGLAGRESRGGLVGVTGAEGKIWIAGESVVRSENLSPPSGKVLVKQPFIMRPYQGVCPTPTPPPTPIPQPQIFVPPVLPEMPDPVRTDIAQPVPTISVPDAIETNMAVIRTATAVAVDATQTRSTPLPSPTSPLP